MNSVKPVKGIIQLKKHAFSLIKRRGNLSLTVRNISQVRRSTRSLIHLPKHLQ